MHSLLCQNPVCSSHRFLSVTFLIFCSRTLQIFPGTCNEFMPLQLLAKSSFFTSFTVMPFFHVSGTYSSCHPLPSKYLHLFCLCYVPCLPFLSDDFFYFMVFDALMFPCYMDAYVLCGFFLWVWSVLLFVNFFKCSVCLWSACSSFIGTLPFLSFTVVVFLVNLPVTVLGILYIVLALPSLLKVYALLSCPCNALLHRSIFFSVSLSSCFLLFLSPCQ